MFLRTNWGVETLKRDPMKQANGAKPGVLDLTLIGMWHNSHVMGPGSQTVKEQRVPIDHPMIMARDVFALQQICHNSRTDPFTIIL